MPQGVAVFQPCFTVCISDCYRKYAQGVVLHTSSDKILVDFITADQDVDSKEVAERPVKNKFLFICLSIFLFIHGTEEASNMVQEHHSRLRLIKVREMINDSKKTQL